MPAAIATTAMIEGTPPDELLGLAALLKLQIWLSPAFPVGAFGYSHGLEAAIAGGLVRTADECRDWIETLLLHGSGWNDLVLFAAAHRAATLGDDGELARIAELAAALSGSAERRRETADLGAAFAAAAMPWGPGGGEAMPYPVVIGALAAREGVPQVGACAAFAQAFGANLLGACVRLVPLGQRQAVAILHRLEPGLAAVARRAGASTLDDLGSAAILSDVQAMRHETLETRLFRT